MVGNIFKAISPIALVSLASLVGCVDVDDAPELGETADSVTSGAAEASVDATSEVGDDVASATALQCNQFEWGQACSRTNSNLDFVGVFHNNRGGGNRAVINIWRNWPGGDYIAKQCDCGFVPYGDSCQCVHYGAVPGGVYRACVRLYDDRRGCSDWSQVQ